MVDPISFGPLRPVEHRKAAAASPDSNSAATAANAEQPTPTFSLSKLTAMARELSDAGAPVDHARIAQIRQAISLGSYRIDPSIIADAMLLYYDSGTP